MGEKAFLGPSYSGAEREIPSILRVWSRDPHIYIYIVLPCVEDSWTVVSSLSQFLRFWGIFDVVKGLMSLRCVIGVTIFSSAHQSKSTSELSTINTRKKAESALSTEYITYYSHIASTVIKLELESKMERLLKAPSQFVHVYPATSYRGVCGIDPATSCCPYVRLS